MPSLLADAAALVLRFLGRLLSGGAALVLATALGVTLLSGVSPSDLPLILGASALLAPVVGLGVLLQRLARRLERRWTRGPDAEAVARRLRAVFEDAPGPVSAAVPAPTDPRS